MKKPSSHLVELAYDAALKSFWRKRALKRFLQRCGVSRTFLAGLTDGTKRDWLDDLFPKLEAADQGGKVILRMARELSEQTAFPDLEDWEDASEKKQAASQAVARLRQAVRRIGEEEEQERDRREVQRRAHKLKQESARSRASLAKLADRLNGLAMQLGTQEAGYDFQPWFYDLMDHCEITSRRPYTTGGRQIDGAITLDGTTYLVELKFTTDQVGATAIDTFHRKVASKADNTMGIMVSISGYSSVAKEEASGDRTPLLLLDAPHLYLVLQAAITFDDLVRRARRHASQTGEAHLAASEFGAASS